MAWQSCRRAQVQGDPWAQRGAVEAATASRFEILDLIRCSPDCLKFVHASDLIWQDMPMYEPGAVSLCFVAVQCVLSVRSHVPSIRYCGRSFCQTVHGLQPLLGNTLCSAVCVCMTMCNDAMSHCQRTSLCIEMLWLDARKYNSAFWPSIKCFWWEADKRASAITISVSMQI